MVRFIYSLFFLSAFITFGIFFEALDASAFSATSSMVSYWDCNETSGVRNDSHGVNDLTDNNTVTYETGVLGNACLFTRANSEYLSITDASQVGLDIANDFTFNVWLRHGGDVNGQYPLLLKDSSTDSARSFNWWYQDNSTPAFGLNLHPPSYGYPRYFSGTFNTTIPTAEYNMYTLVVDVSNGTTTKARIFIDGQPTGYFTLVDGTQAPTTALQQTNSIFSIGYISFMGYYSGAMDEIIVFNAPLSDADILELYNGGIGKTYAQLFATSTIATTTATTTSTSIDTTELIQVTSLFLAFFVYLTSTVIGYKFTKMFF